MVHLGLPVCESATRDPLFGLGINKRWGVSGNRILRLINEGEALEFQTHGHWGA